MSLLLKIIYASHARSTHHKLALDALKHLQSIDSERWTQVLISQHAAYLEGAKAPDDDFKDFKNHVLHVRENFWGGAVASTEHWYGQFIDHLRSSEWKDAAYAAGVLSHYYSDPQMPFHTGQTEAEGAVHRAAEWSVTKSYEKLRDLIEQELGGYPSVTVPTADDWLPQMVRSGAVQANAYYDLLIDHYNLELGVKDPPAGLDRVAEEAVAKCLANATVGFARILDRAFDEASVVPPKVNLTMQAVLATVNGPIRKIVNSLADAQDRKTVEAIYQEVQATGKAIESLPESERLVRQFHAAEVRKVSLLVLNAEKPRRAGQQFGQPVAARKPAPVRNEQKPQPAPVVNAVPKVPVTEPEPAAPLVTEPVKLATAAITSAAITPVSTAGPETAVRREPTPEAAPTRAQHRSAGPRYYLKADAPIVDAPSIGPKTASRFQQLGLTTVDDLLQADADDIASRLNTRHITSDVIRDWQTQSSLMLNVPGLRGHDAQLLVAAKVTTRESLSSAVANDLLDAVSKVADSTQGRSILRDSTPPDLAEVNEWIAAATQATLPLELQTG